jgi:hypothetical protein
MTSGTVEAMNVYGCCALSPCRRAGARPDRQWQAGALGGDTRIVPRKEPARDGRVSSAAALRQTQRPSASSSALLLPQVRSRSVSFAPQDPGVGMLVFGRPGGPARAGSPREVFGRLERLGVYERGSRTYGSPRSGAPGSPPAAAATAVARPRKVSPSEPLSTIPCFAPAGAEYVVIESFALRLIRLDRTEHSTPALGQIERQFGKGRS